MVIKEFLINRTHTSLTLFTCPRYDTVEKLDQRYIFVPSSVRDVYLIYLLRKLLPNAQNAVMGSSAEKGSKSATGGGNNDHNNSRPNKKLKKSRITDDMIQDPSSSSASSKTSAIVFVGKKNLCERVYMMLREVGIRCTSLHSKLSQSERLGSIAKFKSGIVPILVTTDVGSR